MTIEEYDAKVSEMGERLRASWKADNYDEANDLYKKISEFQYEHMEEFLAEYEKTVLGSPLKRICYDLLEYAVHDSQSGNAIVEVDFVTNQEEAKQLVDIIKREIGHYLLDDCDVYQEDRNGQWVADVMFCGNYVPWWDGWKED